MSASVDIFVKKTLHLLEKERSCEIEETRVLNEKLPSKELQRRGVCLLKLHIGERKTGLFGRTLVVFETHLDSLPSHTFSPGDIVGLDHSSSSARTDSLGSGVVTRVSATSITVAFEDTNDLYTLENGLHDYYKLSKLANDVTYKRLKKTLEKLEKGNYASSSQLVSVLFGEQPISPALDVPDLTYFNSGLDASQREAVRFALAQRELAIVHGPPGTGKTTTVIEIILQALKVGSKVLACAPSNIAVDNLVDRLSSSKHRIVRLGHPARLLPHLQKFSLDAILSASEETQVVEDVRRDLDRTLSDLKKARDKGQKQKLREDMKHLRKELRQRETAATKEILKRADVVLVTLTSATDDGPMKLLEESHFDVTIIDEVSQAMEAACWIPLLRSKKCILAGDHLQLPPTIMSKEAAKEGLEVTLMERMLEMYGDPAMRMLTVQYRMHKKIMQWSSTQLYHSRLVAHESVKHHLLRDLPNIPETDLTLMPLLFVDTAGCDMPELDLPEEISKGNEGEADIVRQHVEKLLFVGLKQEEIAVIAPYNLQVELIRLRLAEKYSAVEVKSVDGFQGREKEAVVISLVRSNDKGDVGFLSEKRRINVAVTRARRHLAVIGDSVTVSNDPFLKTLIEYLMTEGAVHSAEEYNTDFDVERPEHLDDLISLAKPIRSKGTRPKQPKKIVDNVKDKKTTIKDMKSHPKEDLLNPSDDKVCELRTRLEDFIANQTLTSIDFPSTLTARDRAIVHELSEKLGLKHISKGTGDDRHIVVSRPGASIPAETPYEKAKNTELSTPETIMLVENAMIESGKSRKKNKKKDLDCTKEVNKDLGDDNNKENPEGGHEDDCKNDVEMKERKATSFEKQNVTNIGVRDGKIRCHICQKDVLKANIMMHEIHCTKQQNSSASSVIPDISSRAKKQAQASKSSTPRQFDRVLASKIGQIDDDDFDALIATVTKLDGNCCFKKCKTSVQTLCQVCDHCSGRYCLAHHVPEVHGCGEAARSAARARISKDGVLYRGSGGSDRSMDPNKKAHLQRKLDSKLTEFSSKRKGNPKK